MDNPEQKGKEPVIPKEFVSEFNSIYEVMMPARGTLSRQSPMAHLDARGQGETGDIISKKVEDLLLRTPYITDNCRDWIKVRVGFDYLIGVEWGSQSLQTIMKNAVPLMENYGYTDQEIFMEIERDCFNAELSACLESDEKMAVFRHEITDEIPEKKSFIRKIAERLKSNKAEIKNEQQTKEYKPHNLTENLYSGWRLNFIETFHQEP